MDVDAYRRLKGKGRKGTGKTRKALANGDSLDLLNLLTLRTWPTTPKASLGLKDVKALIHVLGHSKAKPRVLQCPGRAKVVGLPERALFPSAHVADVLVTLQITAMLPRMAKDCVATTRTLITTMTQQLPVQ